MFYPVPFPVSPPSFDFTTYIFLKSWEWRLLENETIVLHNNNIINNATVQRNEFFSCPVMASFHIIIIASIELNKSDTRRIGGGGGGGGGNFTSPQLWKSNNYKCTCKKIT